MQSSGEPQKPVEAGVDIAARTTPPSKLPRAAGVMILISGILVLLQGAYFFLVIVLSEELTGWPWDYIDTYLSGSFTFCALISVVLAAGALVGGYFAVKRQRLLLAIQGAVLGIIWIGFGVGGILGIVALAMLIISRREFG